MKTKEISEDEMVSIIYEEYDWRRFESENSFKDYPDTMKIRKMRQ